MAKVNVSLPDELLREVDALASEIGESRSGLVREATARYVAEVRARQEAERRREEIENAKRLMRSVASEVAPGEDTTDLIRADRESGHGECE